MTYELAVQIQYKAGYCRILKGVCLAYPLGMLIHTMRRSHMHRRLNMQPVQIGLTELVITGGPKEEEAI